MIVIGIDPGRKGGVAVLAEDRIIELCELPWGGKELNARELFVMLAKYSPADPFVYLENVHAMPGQGVVSMFNFGMSFGMIKGIVAALGYPMYLPAPQTWKAVILKDTDKSKQAAMDYCVRRFPGADLKAGRRTYHDGICDAICIACYGLDKLRR